MGEIDKKSSFKDIMMVSQEFNISLLKTKINLLFPVGGSIINEFVFDLYGRIKQERVNKFVEELSKKVTRLEEIVNLNYLETQECFDLTQKVFGIASNSNSDFKRQFLANVYIDSIKTCNKNIELEILFCGFLDSMTENHVRILQFISYSQKELTEIGSYYSYLEKFESYYPEFRIDKYEFKYYNFDLESKSLISTGAGLDNFDDNSSIRVLSDHKDASVILTSLGEKFINYLIG